MTDPSSPSLRPDFITRQRSIGDHRSTERVIAHYRLERELSERLRCTPREARPLVYMQVYAELFASLSDHPQHSRPAGPARVEAQLRQIAGELRPNAAFLELGCGDAALAFAVARLVGTVYGLDVTDALIDQQCAPPNFRFLRTNGVNVPLPDDAIDFAYSHQLMEHLHPDDAADQLREVYRVLKPGGRYMCITPSRVTGPHDISRYFDYEATGLHLREYDYGDLRALFSEAGFGDFSCVAWVRGHQIPAPYAVLRAIEKFLLSLPCRMRASLTRPQVVEAILGLNIIATK